MLFKFNNDVIYFFLWSQMVVKNGKYERIAISSLDSPASQVALTEYKVIGSHQHG